MMTQLSIMFRRAMARASSALLCGLSAGFIAAGSASADERLLGVWDGEYVCAQGITNVELVFDRIETDGSVHGAFNFFAHSQNPGVPTGSYHLYATVQDDGRTVVAVPGDWTKRPVGYVSVSFSATLTPTELEMNGMIDGPGCSAFSARKRPGVNLF